MQWNNYRTPRDHSSVEAYLSELVPDKESLQSLLHCIADALIDINPKRMIILEGNESSRHLINLIFSAFSKNAIVCSKDILTDYSAVFDNSSSQKIAVVESLKDVILKPDFVDRVTDGERFFNRTDVTFKALPRLFIGINHETTSVAGFQDRPEKILFISTKTPAQYKEIPYTALEFRQFIRDLISY